VRYFFSTGEPSGELAAVTLAQAIRVFDPAAQFEGIGAGRMRDAGFSVWCDTTNWASMGPLEAVQRIPKLYVNGMHVARRIAKSEPDVLVLVDFGGFNVRLAKLLRTRMRYTAPILDWFPPATWLDNEQIARDVATFTVPLTAFERQYNFYKQLQLPIVYFGHPLASRYTMRSARSAAPLNGGSIALLPGSRTGELKQHVPVLVQAYRLLQTRRPDIRATIGVADALGEKYVRRAFDQAGFEVTIVRNIPAAIADADAAWVASGTAVLETVLSGVPAIALYILPPMLAWHARRVYTGRYITLPNLILGREVVPEILQERATPQNLAEAMDELLRNPQRQYEQFAALRSALGPADALERVAKFTVALAQAGRAA